jgi:hypothetical protein
MIKKAKAQSPATKKKIDERLLFILEEEIPRSQTERKKYVGDVAFFYATIFKKKLEHFIGTQLEELAQIGRSEEGNNIIRANINAFRLIDDWMKLMTSEHQGNLNEIRNSFDDTGKIIKELNKTYGENKTS